MNDQQAINYIKGLIIDGVHQAKSGHPGGAMSSVDFAYILLKEFLQYDPDNIDWPGRDRFILSAGHESMLLYAMLYLQGWLQLDDLKQFRQYGSRTPGHPENTVTPGVECTTGPLGQGAAMSVGFAVAAQFHKSQFHPDLFSQNIYCLVGDGCIQEEVTQGAASLAGHLKLGNLIWYYDCNQIQISGGTDRSISDDHVKVFEGFGWQVMEIDGHDHSQIRHAIRNAKAAAKPALIIGHTKIANGAVSLAGSAKTHGAPLPEDERKETKALLGIPENTSFHLPQEAITHFQEYFDTLREKAQQWQGKFAELCETQEGFGEKFEQFFHRKNFQDLSQPAWDTAAPMATRNAFGKLIDHWAEEIPNLMGGSADLEPSNMTGAFAKKVGDFQAQHYGNRNLCFGVREFTMSGVANGMALFGGVIPFDATFLTFSDYSRPALRLGALQKIRVIHEFTHDSFYLGEDGPTHQPVEHIMSLRLIPELKVMRPADSIETEILLRNALESKDETSVLCLTRQKVPYLPLPRNVVEKAARGAYTVLDCRDPELIIIATGSEVSLSLKAAESLENVRVKVVSMPCWELFEAQDQSYQEEVLSPNCSKRVSIEAGRTLGWQKYTGSHGLNIGIDHFGASAKASDLEEQYGFTPKAVVAKIRQFLN